MFEQSDANKDGKLSRDEAPGFFRDRFDEVDTNKDGFISRDEDTALPPPGRSRRPCSEEGGRSSPRRKAEDREAALTSGRRII